MELSELAREARNKYAREWRAKNREKSIANNIRYWEKKGLESNLDPNDDTDKLSVTNNRNITVTCISCGVLFTPKRSDARYCSTACRVSYNRNINRVFKK